MKTYTFKTIDSNDHIETYTVEACDLKDAKEYRNEIIGNSLSGEDVCGHIRLA